jgi:hypothetical protein
MNEVHLLRTLLDGKTLRRDEHSEIEENPAHGFDRTVGLEQMINVVSLNSQYRRQCDRLVKFVLVIKAPTDLIVICSIS